MGKNIIKKIDPSQIKYTPIEGEIIQSPSGEYMIWHDEKWNGIKIEGSGVEISLYEMNKQIISQLPVIEDFSESKKLVNSLHNIFNNKYYMLYGKELSYFTLFEIKNPINFWKSVEECLKNIGPVKSIEITEPQDALEIWVQVNDEATCLYLFPYDTGLVEV